MKDKDSIFSSQNNLNRREIFALFFSEQRLFGQLEMVICDRKLKINGQSDL